MILLLYTHVPRDIIIYSPENMVCNYTCAAQLLGIHICMYVVLGAASQIFGSHQDLLPSSAMFLLQVQLTGIARLKIIQPQLYFHPPRKV